MKILILALLMAALCAVLVLLFRRDFNRRK